MLEELFSWKVDETSMPNFSAGVKVYVFKSGLATGIEDLTAKRFSDLETVGNPKVAAWKVLLLISPLNNLKNLLTISSKEMTKVFQKVMVT